MHKLLRTLCNQLQGGLRRQSIKTCSAWSQEYRVMGPPFPGPWSFKHHPWLRQPHDDLSEQVVIQKAAQMGFTEWALNKTFYHIDIKGENVIYVLPASTPDASDFSTSRFDPALEMSKHLSTLFSDVKNVGHKRAGNANLFIRGSRSKSQLRSTPAPLIIFDEVDVMVQENIALAFERVSGQLESQKLLLSTPTVDQYGINEFFQASTQEHFTFRCPACNRFTELTYPDCLVITGDDPTIAKILESHLVCKECKAVLHHEEKESFLSEGTWVPTHKDKLTEGYHINQMYSMTVKPSDLAISYLKSLNDPSNEQEFYNSKLGMTHIVKGARITDEMLLGCTGGYRTVDSVSQPGLITMGVDVGGWLHYEIVRWTGAGKSSDLHLSTRGQVLRADKCKDFEFLDTLMRQYKIIYVVIDANPERRKSLEFCQRFYGNAKMCFYGNAVQGKSIHVHKEDEHTLTVDRTSWMDVALGRIKAGTISLPADISLEYRKQLKVPIRVYRKDSSGNQVGSYVKGNEDDHFAHARTYNELALAMAAGIGSSKDIAEEA